MNKLTAVQLNAPYLILIGDLTDPTYAKTGFGIVQWRPDLVAGQLRFAGCEVDMGVPDLSVSEALEAGAKSLLIGVAPIGGVVPDSWWASIEEAAIAGLDIICGLHFKLADFPRLVSAAQSSGARLIDVRNPPADIPVGTGVKRTGKRVLMVGTDCAIGKKYSALALDQAMCEAGMKSDFRATGQTGIMLAGEGIPIDAVVADFISGAAELISPNNDEDHWDVIEGQGSLFHPGYSGVSLGLLHGSQPDAFVVCHDATRTAISGWEHYALPSIEDCIDQHVLIGSRTNPDIRCVGISVNTSQLPANERSAYLASLSEETGLPCVDPLIDGCGAIVNYIKQIYTSHSLDGT
ncbi:MAG: DUF1611 domain-containing protein [Xanthomonadales bacterium]|nr:DUF1611 domain-containing protein [Xanthomonadales bacterium]